MHLNSKVVARNRQDKGNHHKMILPDLKNDIKKTSHHSATSDTSSARDFQLPEITESALVTLLFSPNRHTKFA